jgi:hypothetical protein
MRDYIVTIICYRHVPYCSTPSDKIHTHRTTHTPMNAHPHPYEGVGVSVHFMGEQKKASNLKRCE